MIEQQNWGLQQMSRASPISLLATANPRKSNRFTSREICPIPDRSAARVLARYWFLAPSAILPTITSKLSNRRGEVKMNHSQIHAISASRELSNIWCCISKYSHLWYICQQNKSFKNKMSRVATQGDKIYSVSIQMFWTKIYIYIQCSRQGPKQRYTWYKYTYMHVF